MATFDGGKIEWRDVYDELSTQSLFGGGGPRLVMVDPADDFITRNRDRLEDYLAAAKQRQRVGADG